MPTRPTTDFTHPDNVEGALALAVGKIQVIQAQLGNARGGLQGAIEQIDRQWAERFAGRRARVAISGDRALVWGLWPGPRGIGRLQVESRFGGTTPLAACGLGLQMMAVPFVSELLLALLDQEAPRSNEKAGGAGVLGAEGPAEEAP